MYTTFYYNPYTGKMRDMRDIQSDPLGVLIVDPNIPLAAAKPKPVLTKWFASTQYPWVPGVYEVYMSNGAIWFSMWNGHDWLMCCGNIASANKETLPSGFLKTFKFQWRGFTSPV